jgi:serine/threonine protein kinase
MSTRTTTARKQRGTMPYMAPEVIAGQTYRRSSDVYSFGILLCEMINRSLPYADLNDYQIMFGVSSNNLRPNIDDNVPEHMRSLIIKYVHLTIVFFSS